MDGTVSLITSLDPAAPIPPERAARPELPLGVYVHIPFCVRKCHYCDFAAGPAPPPIREQYVETLAAEIRRSPQRGAAARTVFFGGGTPSELNSAQLGQLVAALRETFSFPAGGEWTIECNPGTIDVSSLRAMRDMGFDRISLGVQTFHDHHLRALGRIHTAEEAAQAVGAARAAGFRRLNLDLIFCLPGQTLPEWREDLEQALTLEPEHLSLYNLTIEKETEFGRRHRAGLLTLPDEDLSADMYEWALDRTAAAGFAQYEVSNFARAGEECRHNQIYWRQEPFLGFGLGAASYLNGARWVNSRGMQRYLATALRDEGPELSSVERLAPREAAGESVMLGLRTADGVDLARVAGRYGLDLEACYGETVCRLEGDGLVAREGSRVRLTRRGLMLANLVCGEFLGEH
jgi:oxygen-independent coproporphyrinogen III oxidase